MELCELVEIEGRPGFQECRKCGRGRFWPQGQKKPSAMPANYRRECVGPGVDPTPPPRPGYIPPKPQREPTIVEKAKSFSQALAKQRAAGDPQRSDGEKAIIWDRCNQCPAGKFRPDPVVPIALGGGTCRACGCGIDKIRKLFNAAAFATYKCTLGHWDDLIASGQIRYVVAP